MPEAAPVVRSVTARTTTTGLLPYLTRVAAGRQPRLSVHGTDYDTADGTPVRDFLPVVDLAQAHVAALRHLLAQERSITANIGTGRGVSVGELAATFARVNQVAVPWAAAPRRPGDVASCHADHRRAAAELGWTARLSLDDMCADAWRWHTRNPDGYDGQQARGAAGLPA